MQDSEIAQFFASLGHRVIKTQSCYWYNPSRFLFKTLPVHRLVEPSAAELAKVLMMGPAIALRYPKPAGESGTQGGMYVCADRDYDFASLSPSARSHTRRGLARCTVTQLDFKYLARHGYALTEATNIRQTGKPPHTTRTDWERFCDRAAAVPGFEAWGAMVNSQLAAYIVAMLVEDCYYIYLQKSATELLRYYPNNALTFAVIKAKLANPEIAYISHGPKAIAASDGLHYFKMSMGFQMQPFSEQVVFNPILKPAVSWKGDMLVRSLTRRYPESLFWQRASKAINMAKNALTLHEQTENEPA
jgi:hypothetical protein